MKGIIVCYDPAEGTRLKSHSATTKGGKTLVKVEIEVTDYYRLGYLMRSLDEAAEAQRKDDHAAKAAAQKTTKSAAKKPLALPAPQLLLPHDGGAK